ncbi:MAG: ABC transporter substrate-binding protein [Chloroflexota bacterium]
MRRSQAERSLTRRDFLCAGAVATAAGLMAACAPAATPTPSAPPAPAAPTPVKPAAQVPQVPQIQSTAAPTQAPAATKTSGPKTGGTLTLAKTMGVQDFNPVNLFTGHYAFQRALFNTLAHYDSQLNPVPELAEKWDFAADSKSMTLKLREGVKFHSGRDFTSADVKASVDFASNDEKTTMRSLFKTITAVETPEKYVAVFKFASLNPGIFDILDTLFIIDKDTIANRANTAVGTGPFKLDKYLPNDRVEMVANKDYWEKGKPYLDRYVMREIPDVSALTINLESGAVDCIWQPTFIDLVRLKGTGGKYVTDMGAPGASMYNIAINCKQEPFTNKKVRQAVAWAIDRERFCKTTLQGLVPATCVAWPPHSWAYFKDLEGRIGYDLEKAKALLKEAGLANGFETELVTSAKRTFGLGDIGTILQADLKKIGINAKVSDLEPAQYEARVVNKGEMPMACIVYGRLNRDPGSMLTGAKAWYTDKQGAWTHFESEEYEKLRTEIQSTLDREKRKVTARKIQELALDECFTNPIADNPRAWAYANHVKGFGYDMDNAPFVANVWLEK